MSNLNLEILKRVPIPIPVRNEQEEIVRRVEGLFKIADRIGTRYQEAKRRMDSLGQSILSKALRGELVPQNPSDEPAERVLERITQNQENGRGRTIAGHRRNSG